jgi:two-component system OmpR family response regulator
MRILVVEDDTKMASIIQRGLKEEGHAVDTAFDGSQCKALAARYSYDLFILDVVLTGEDGFAVCRTLRDSGVKSPVLMLTCKSEVADRVAGLDCGADDYMTKPFAFEELAARVRALLRRQPELVPAVLQAGKLVMDMARRQVWYDGRTVNLTLKEFAVLELLLRNPNSVVTRFAFEEHVWNQQLDSGSNLVDVYIQKLRQKVGEEGSRLIQTVHGVGYRLTLP